MSDSQHGNAIGQSNEHDVIRKVVNGKLANIRIGKARQECSGQWELLEMLEGALDFGGESFRNLFVALAIPGDRFAQITSGGAPKADTLQRDNTSLCTSARTTRQSSSSSGFSRASAARRAISAAQAASTSASTASRLASRPAANSARSFAGSVNASTRSFCAVVVTASY